MDETVMLLLLVTLCLKLGWGQEIDMNITLETNVKSIISALGDRHILQCYAKGDSGFFISNPIKWTHEGTDGTRTVISRLMAETDISDRYHVSDKSTGVLGSLELIITDVQASDDGKFICSIENRLSKIKLNEVYVDFIVIHPIQSMSFEMNSENFQSKTYLQDFNQTNSLTIPKGSYSLTCAVNGSNPEPEIRIIFGEKELTSEMQLFQNNNSNSLIRSYYAQNTASISISEIDSSDILLCETSLRGVPKSNWTFSYNITVLPNIAPGTFLLGTVIRQLLFTTCTLYMIFS